MFKYHENFQTLTVFVFFADITATHRNASVFVEDDLQQMWWENRRGLELLLLLGSVGILMVRTRRRAGEV